MFFSPVRAPSHISRAVLNGYGYVPSAWSRSDTFDRFFSDAAADANTRSQVESDETTITLSLDVPGLSKEQLTVAIDGGIEGRIVRISSKDDAPRSFKAAYKLGSDVDAGKSEAKLENGVLTLKFSKIAPESRQTLLTIN
jgi:HSP20 family protein